MRHHDIKKIEINVFAGTDIDVAAQEAIDLAKKNECTVEFYFNGILLAARPTTTTKNINEQYNFLIGIK